MTPPTPDREEGGKRERMARALIKALEIHKPFLMAPLPGDSLQEDRPGDQTYWAPFDAMVVDGEIDGWAIIDAVLEAAKDPA
jgi:hypothetical protein